MLLNNIVPSENLQSIVRFYRIIDFNFSREPNITIPIKAYRPRIEHCLQFTPFDCEFVDYTCQKNISHKVAVFGQQTTLSYRKVGRRFLNFQIVFQPGVLNTILKCSVNELTDVYTDAELFFGKQIHYVNEQLATCKNYQEMIASVELFLTGVINRTVQKFHPINRIACLLASSSDNVKNIEWYANQANLCYRQFDRAFKNNTGITPKDFRTLTKLDTAYLLKNRNPQKNWLSIALESGFYDYQHLAKNYKRFLAHLPAEFYYLEQQAPERHFGDFEQ